MSETDVTDSVLTGEGWKTTRIRDGFDGSVVTVEIPGPHYASATQTVTTHCTWGMKFDRSTIVTPLLPGPELESLLLKFGKQP